MKKLLLLLVLCAGLGAASGAGAAWVGHGEWSDWWEIGNAGEVRRIYDHENKLVCWVFASSFGGGISCVPSLELNHPATW